MKTARQYIQLTKSFRINEDKLSHGFCLEHLRLESLPYVKKEFQENFIHDKIPYHES